MEARGTNFSMSMLRVDSSCTACGKSASGHNLQITSADCLKGEARVAVGIADGGEVIQGVILRSLPVEITNFKVRSRFRELVKPEAFRY
jgi:hypothetical protein